MCACAGYRPQTFLTGKWIKNILQHRPGGGQGQQMIKIDLQNKLKTRGLLIPIQIIRFLQFYLIGLFQMTSAKRDPLSLDSRVQLEPNSDSDRKLIYEDELSEYQRFIKKQENLKNNLAFWNGMAEGKLETISSCGNLFILLLILTLGGSLYNGKGTEGPKVLGWICVAQVCFFYVLVLLVKFIYIPSIERQLQQWASQGLKLYKVIQQGKKQIKNLELSELELLHDTVANKSDHFVRCFPSANVEIVLNEIKSTLASRSSVPYRSNSELRQVKLREKKAKYWQTFWQVFILGKTFSIPGVLLLVFIITPLSIATIPLTSELMRNGQGWLAIGFWAAGIIVYIIIKFFLWEYFNEMAEKARSDSFVAYYPVSLKHKELKNLSLPQLQALEKVLSTRAREFEQCFSESANEVLNRVKDILRQRLPNKKSEEDQRSIKQIIAEQKEIQSYTASWNSFFSLRLIVTIINIQKFLIVMAITFVEYYPNQSDIDALNYARRVVGSIGIAFFGLGYIFYFFMHGVYLPYLDRKINALRSSPFTTFRLVYFGNKKLNDLEVHQLEDVSDGLNNRRGEFLQCFRNVNPETLDRDIQALIDDKTAPYKGADKAHDLLKKQAEAKKTLAFWTSYVDSPLMTSMYSVYVILVLMIVSLTATYQPLNGVKVNQIMGWVGLANLSALIIIVIVFKTFLIDYMTTTTKALRVEGYSEFNLVYTNTKELSAVDLPELNKIQQIIENNPIDFRRCFPKADLNTTLKNVKEAIATKIHQKNAARIRTAAEQVEYQKLTLELSRSTTALASWTSLVKDKLFVLTPIAIVIYILWAQTIATSLYGITVSGFLTVANLSVITCILLFYNLFYRGYLEDKINTCKNRIKALETREPQVLNF